MSMNEFVPALNVVYKQITNYLHERKKRNQLTSLKSCCITSIYTYVKNEWAPRSCIGYSFVSLTKFKMSK